MIGGGFYEACVSFARFPFARFYFFPSLSFPLVVPLRTFGVTSIRRLHECTTPYNPDRVHNRRDSRLCMLVYSSGLISRCYPLPWMHASKSFCLIALKPSLQLSSRLPASVPARNSSFIAHEVRCYGCSISTRPGAISPLSASSYLFRRFYLFIILFLANDWLLTSAIFSIYTVPILIGSNNQSLSLQVDMGSSDLVRRSIHTLYRRWRICFK